MIDYLGLIISGLSTIFFSIKNPWEKRILKTKITLGLIGIILLIGGLIVSGIITINNNKEKNEYKSQLIDIDSTINQTLITTKDGVESLLRSYEDRTNELLLNFSSNYNTLMTTIIEQSDSTLKSQLNKLKMDYESLNKDLIVEKNITHRYYFSEEWPFSDSEKDISGDMFFFIPVDLEGQVDGTDRYIIWTLINNNGSYSYNKIDSLHEEIWNYLKPIKLSLGVNLQRLTSLSVIKPDFWKSEKIEFTDEFMERLKVYQIYKDTDEYVPKLIEVYKKYRMK